jgi:hypothetical protein
MHGGGPDHHSLIPLADGSTRVHWEVDAERLGSRSRIGEEDFTVQADTANGLRNLLSNSGFEVELLFGAYDVNRPYVEGDSMLVAVARRKAP